MYLKWAAVEADVLHIVGLPLPLKRPWRPTFRRHPRPCYAMVLLPGWKPGFRTGFRPDSHRENFKIGPPAGRMLVGGIFCGPPD